MDRLQKERLPQLDFFRALAIIGVLHVHATSDATIDAADTSIYYVFNFLNLMFKYGTPAFIFLSSFVLFYNYFDRPLTGKLISGFYKKRILYILLPYILISALYLFYKLYTRGLLGEPVMMLLRDYVDAIFSGTAWTHLYFVFISVQFYILFPLMLVLLKNYRWMARWAIVIGLVVEWAWVFGNKYEFQYANKGSIAFSYFAYYMLGAFVAIYFQPFRQWVMTRWSDMNGRLKRMTAILWASWLATGLLYVQIWYHSRMTDRWMDSLWYELMWNVYTMLSCLVLFQAAFIVNRIAPKLILAVLRRLGELSFAIYLVHPFILAYYRDTKSWFTLAPLAYFIWVYSGLIIALVLSALLVQFLFRRFSYSWILLGSIPYSLSERHRKRKLQRKQRRQPKVVQRTMP